MKSLAAVRWHKVEEQIASSARLHGHKVENIPTSHTREQSNFLWHSLLLLPPVLSHSRTRLVEGALVLFIERNFQMVKLS
ncbi:hypothetical protein M5689_009796 [Euphorbia peplus]|nr:hypothetical protein M5689_009796 [Euphorbia peplus]